MNVVSGIPCLMKVALPYGACRSGWLDSLSLCLGLYFFFPAWIASTSKKCFCYLNMIKSSSIFFICTSFWRILELYSSIFLSKAYFLSAIALASSWADLEPFSVSFISTSNFSLSSFKNFYASANFSCSIVMYSLSLSFSLCFKLIDMEDINIYRDVEM